MIVITLDPTGAAFEPDESPEASRIINTLADRIAVYGLDTVLNSYRKLHDANGNSVGTIEVCK